MHAELRDETVLLDTGRGTALALNAAGGRLWDLLAEPARIDALARSLATDFEIEPARALSDTRAFAAEMLERGLIETTASA